MNTRRIPLLSMIVTNSVLLYPHIVYDRKACRGQGGFSVGGEQFPVNVFGQTERTSVEIHKGKRGALVSMELGTQASRLVSRVGEDEVQAYLFVQSPKVPVRKNDNHRSRKPIFVTTKSALRVPMSVEYWKKWNELERSGAGKDEIRAQKNMYKKDCEYRFDVRESGVAVIAPDSDVDAEGRRDQATSYLLALTERSEFELLLSRKSPELPNTYRVEFANGTLRVIDPRAEAREENCLAAELVL